MSNKLLFGQGSTSSTSEPCVAEPRQGSAHATPPSYLHVRGTSPGSQTLSSGELPRAGVPALAGVHPRTACISRMTG